MTTLQGYVKNINWTQNLTTQFQKFYNNASRTAYYGTSASFSFVSLSKIPDYIDLPQTNCTAQQNISNYTNTLPQCGLATRHQILILLLFFPFFIKTIFHI